MNRIVQDSKKRFTELSDHVEEVQQSITKKLNITEFDQFVTIDQKKTSFADIYELEQILEKKANKESVREALKTKVSAKELKQVQDKLAHCEKDLSLKANIKDILTLLDEKASKLQDSHLLL